MEADGWDLVEDAAQADVAVVNTCGFVEAAKKDSVDALLEANDLKGHGRTQAVVAVGCMAERYGKELAEALPEADGVLGFDDYSNISDRLQTILSGGVHASHTPATGASCCRSAPPSARGPRRTSPCRDTGRPHRWRPPIFPKASLRPPVPARPCAAGWTAPRSPR